MLGPFKRSLDRRFDSERKRIWRRRRKKRTQKNKKVLGGPNSVRRKKLLMRIKKKGRSCRQRPLADPKAIMWECTLNDLPMAGPMDIDVRSNGTFRAWHSPEEKKERKIQARRTVQHVISVFAWSEAHGALRADDVVQDTHVRQGRDFIMCGGTVVQLMHYSEQHRVM